MWLDEGVFAPSALSNEHSSPQVWAESAFSPFLCFPPLPGVCCHSEGSLGAGWVLHWALSQSCGCRAGPMGSPLRGDASPDLGAFIRVHLRLLQPHGTSALWPPGSVSGLLLCLAPGGIGLRVLCQGQISFVFIIYWYFGIWKKYQTYIITMKPIIINNLVTAVKNKCKKWKWERTK